MEFKLNWPSVFSVCLLVFFLRKICLDYYVGTQNERLWIKGQIR